jgi:hypothetical protein
MPATERAAGAPLQEIVFGEDKFPCIRVNIPGLFLAAGFFMQFFVQVIHPIGGILFFILKTVEVVRCIHYSTF